MSTSQEFSEFLLWEATTRDTIDFKKVYVDMADDLIAGLLLSQIVYWTLPNREGKTKLRVRRNGHLWIAKGRSDWWDEIRITDKQFDRASKILEKKDLIVTALFKFAGSPTKHVRIEQEGFLTAWQSVLTQRVKSNLPKGKNGIYPKGENELPQTGDSNLPKEEEPITPKGKLDLPLRGESLTETTSETTPKTLTETTAETTTEDAIASLTDIGVAYPVALQLVADHGIQFVLDWITYAQNAENIRDLPAFAVAMIQSGESAYAPVPGYAVVDSSMPSTELPY